MCHQWRSVTNHCNLTAPSTLVSEKQLWWAVARTVCDTDGLKWGCPWGCSVASISKCTVNDFSVSPTEVTWLVYTRAHHNTIKCAHDNQGLARLCTCSDGRAGCKSCHTCVSWTVTPIDFQHPPSDRLHRWYFLSSSDCHMFFLSGKRSGILMRRKSWMHFSSSCSGVIFSLFAFLFAASRSRTPKVLTRSMSVLRRISACCSMWTGPLGMGRSSVWALGRRIIGPPITVPCGELASDWVSEQEVESSLKEVPLSPSCSLLWLLQQQSQWEDIHREGPPKKERSTDASLTSRSRVFSFSCRHSVSQLSPWWRIQVIIKRNSRADPAKTKKRRHSSLGCQTNINKARRACGCVWAFAETHKSLVLTINC